MKSLYSSVCSFSRFLCSRCLSWQFVTDLSLTWVGARFLKNIGLQPMFSLSFQSCMRMGCSPARFSKFQIKFSSGCSPLWITYIEIEFYSGRCPIFKKILAYSPCFPEVFRLVREWVEAHLGCQNLKLSFTRIVAHFG